MKQLLIALAVLATLSAMPAHAQNGLDDNECVSPSASVKRNRPDVDGPAVEVGVAVFLIDLLGIHDSQERFDINFALRLSWHDPRLDYDGLQNCDLTPSDIWLPQIGVLNQIDVRDGDWVRIDVDTDGYVLYERRISGSLSAVFELDEFPRDSQVLPVRLGSLVYGPEDVLLRVDHARTGRAPLARQAGWEIVAGSSDTEPLLAEHGMSRALVVHSILVEREFGYWFWKLLVPLSLIVLMAWSVFWLDPRIAPPQITVGASAIFTLIAFQLSLGETLPKISYLTLADKLVLTATVLVFFALGQAVVTSRLAQRDQLERARRLDLYGRWIYPLAYITSVLFVLL